MSPQNQPNQAKIRPQTVFTLVHHTNNADAGLACIPTPNICEILLLSTQKFGLETWPLSVCLYM